MSKRIPIFIVDIIKDALKKFNVNVRFINDPNVVFHIIDLDEKSDFKYVLENFYTSEGKPKCKIHQKPANSYNPSEVDHYISLENLKEHFENWLKLISAFTYFDDIDICEDKIEAQYEEEFFKDFDIIDEDADYSAFNLRQQLQLDSYLNEINNKLEQLKIGKPKEEQEVLTQIQGESNDIQKNLSKEPKRKIIKRIAKMFAKAQKAGLHIIKEIFVEVSSEVIVKLLTGGQS